MPSSLSHTSVINALMLADVGRDAREGTTLRTSTPFRYVTNVIDMVEYDVGLTLARVAWMFNWGVCSAT